jgi:putative transposase
MSRKGNAYDNAVVESIFDNLKDELVHHRGFATREEARAEIFDDMELFYNRRRAHATLQYLSPVDSEDSRRVLQTNCPGSPG